MFVFNGYVRYLWVQDLALSNTSGPYCSLSYVNQIICLITSKALPSSIEIFKMVCMCEYIYLFMHSFIYL